MATIVLSCPVSDIARFLSKTLLFHAKFVDVPLLILAIAPHQESLPTLGLWPIGVRARGGGGLQRQNHFRAKAKFFGQKPAAKNEKNCIY